jgi:CRISPR type I-E-associated protein CasB/Cse2
MTESKTRSPAALVDELRAVRARFDKLPRGDVAVLRRCRTADEIALEGDYWRIRGGLARDISHVVLLFPLAGQANREGFSFGRFLRHQLRGRDGKVSPAATLRFRRLLDSRDKAELTHRLRGLLRLACAAGAPVDWGALGSELVWFFAESGSVRRRWAQDFYAPTSSSLTGPSIATP